MLDTAAFTLVITLLLRRGPPTVRNPTPCHALLAPATRIISLVVDSINRVSWFWLPTHVGDKVDIGRSPASANANTTSTVIRVPPVSRIFTPADRVLPAVVFSNPQPENFFGFAVSAIDGFCITPATERSTLPQAGCRNFLERAAFTETQPTDGLLFAAPTVCPVQNSQRTVSPAGKIHRTRAGMPPTAATLGMSANQLRSSNNTRRVVITVTPARPAGTHRVAVYTIGRHTNHRQHAIAIADQVATPATLVLFTPATRSMFSAQFGGANLRRAAAIATAQPAFDCGFLQRLRGHLDDNKRSEPLPNQISRRFWLFPLLHKRNR